MDGVRLRTQGPGDFFGEMALLSGAPRSADVTALDYSRFAKLSARDFHRFLRRYPELHTPVAALAAERESNTPAVRPSAAEPPPPTTPTL